MKHLLKHPAVRTRVLYEWETQNLYLDKRNTRFDQKMAEKFAVDFWKWEGRVDQKCPLIAIQFAEYSWCKGRNNVVLAVHDSGPVVLTHELVHAKGYGAGKSMHSVSFVREYIRCLSRFVGFNHADLVASAAMRGLV